MSNKALGRQTKKNKQTKNANPAWTLDKEYAAILLGPPVTASSAQEGH
jgi:hypothetical protein